MWNVVCALVRILVCVLTVMFAIAWWSTASRSEDFKSQMLFTIASLLSLGVTIHLAIDCIAR